MKLSYTVFLLSAVSTAVLGAPIPEPEPIIGSPCFGSSATGCTLTGRTNSEAAPVLAPVIDTGKRQIEEKREAIPEPEPIIGSPCFGSSATGCTLSG
jgi:hypothetical protein